MLLFSKVMSLHMFNIYTLKKNNDETFAFEICL